MYDEYKKLVKEIGELKVEIVSINDLIREELKTHIPAPPKSLNPYDFGDPYDPKKKEKVKKSVKSIRLGLEK